VKGKGAKEEDKKRKENQFHCHVAGNSSSGIGKFP